MSNFEWEDITQIIETDCTIENDEWYIKASIDKDNDGSQMSAHIKVRRQKPYNGKAFYFYVERDGSESWEEACEKFYLSKIKDQPRTEEYYQGIGGHSIGRSEF